MEERRRDKWSIDFMEEVLEEALEEDLGEDLEGSAFLEVLF
jgi:hypothetical protein